MKLLWYRDIETLRTDSVLNHYKNRQVVLKPLRINGEWDFILNKQKSL
jgi:hypothetical protein